MKSGYKKIFAAILCMNISFFCKGSVQSSATINSPDLVLLGNFLLDIKEEIIEPVYKLSFFGLHYIESKNLPTPIKGQAYVTAKSLRNCLETLNDQLAGDYTLKDYLSSVQTGKLITLHTGKTQQLIKDLLQIARYVKDHMMPLMRCEDRSFAQFMNDVKRIITKEFIIKLQKDIEAVRTLVDHVIPTVPSETTDQKRVNQHRKNINDLCLQIVNNLVNTNKKLHDPRHTLSGVVSMYHQEACKHKADAWNSLAGIACLPFVAFFMFK